jgi:manganese/zinc/iron transport system permease protein
VWRVFSLQDYNTRVVLLGTAMFGAAGGVIGTFLTLRKRALLSDAVAHATLPGVAVAFLAIVYLGGSGKNLAGLLLGAAIFGVAGMLCVLIIRRYSRLKDDAALGIILSVLFALGITLVGIATRVPQSQAAGLNSFIYGKTASMTLLDAQLIGGVALAVCVLCLLFFKEFALLCFDQGYMSTQGWPALRIDIALMTLVVIVTVIGLQAVGLILVVALLIIPPSAARYWTEDLRWTAIIAALAGVISCFIGAGISALFQNLPAGALIVVSASVVFVFSMLFGRARGMFWQLLQYWALRRKVKRQHLLRAMWELNEREAVRGEPGKISAAFDDLLEERSWTAFELWRVLKRAIHEGIITETHSNRYSLTPSGIRAARQVVRNHRLWELYLIHYSDVAPGVVDRGADRIEHVLDPEVIERLEQLTIDAEQREPIPASPHELHGPQRESSGHA